MLWAAERGASQQLARAHWLLALTILVVMASVWNLHCWEKLAEKMVVPLANFVMPLTYAAVIVSSLALVLLIIMIGQYRGELLAAKSIAKWCLLEYIAFVGFFLAGRGLPCGAEAAAVAATVSCVGLRMLEYCIIVSLAIVLMLVVCYSLAKRIYGAMV